MPELLGVTLNLQRAARPFGRQTGCSLPDHLVWSHCRVVSLNSSWIGSSHGCRVTVSCSFLVRCRSAPRPSQPAVIPHLRFPRGWRCCLYTLSISCTSHCAMFIGDLIVCIAGLFSPLVLQVVCVYSFIACVQSVACTVLLLIRVSQAHVQRQPCRQVGRLGWLIASALSRRAASCCTALFEQEGH